MLSPVSGFSGTKPHQNGRLGEATTQSASREAAFRKKEQKGTYLVSTKLLSTREPVTLTWCWKGQRGQAPRTFQTCPLPFSRPISHLLLTSDTQPPGFLPSPKLIPTLGLSTRSLTPCSALPCEQTSRCDPFSLPKASSSHPTPTWLSFLSPSAPFHLTQNYSHVAFSEAIVSLSPYLLSDPHPLECRFPELRDSIFSFTLGAVLET